MYMNIYIQSNPYYRPVDTMEFYKNLFKIFLKFIRHLCILFLIYRTYQTHDTFPQYYITVVAAILVLFQTLSLQYATYIGARVNALLLTT